jgi:hypothetical protein
VTEIGNIKWNLLINAKDLDTQTKTDIFYDTVNDIIDTCQPLKTSRIRGDQPWMTPQIKEEMAIRQRLYHANKSEEWKKQASKVRKMIKKRKRKYYQRYERGDPIWWDEVKIIKGEKNKSNEMNQEKCEKLNEYFHSVWENTQKSQLSNHLLRDPNDKPIKISETQVMNELNKLDTKKAAGPDKLSAKTLKAARFEVVEIITHIFNECLANNVVPSQWKEANIAPVPKTKKPANPEDYRPVCLTSTLCKVLERILAKIIFQETKALWKINQQYGFLPEKSTTDALIQVIEDWANAIDKNEIVWAIFFDFSKAFDLVDHEILMKKLEKYLPRWLTTWIAQYLLDRKQRVKAGDKTTEWKGVEAGVVQGSVLGPILFIIFLSDIEEYMPNNIKSPKYADDILAYCMTKKGEENRIQEAADAVLKWTSDNKMKLNIKKTQCLAINEPESERIISIGNETITRTDSYKYLGTIITSKLSWNEQWEHISKKFNSALYLIKTMKNLGFKKEILITVYKSLMLSHIISNSAVLCSASKQIKQEIESIQNKVLKIIGINSDEEKEKYKIEPTENTIEKQCMTTMAKILDNQDHHITMNLKKKENIRTRNNYPFQIQKCNKQQYQDSFVQKYMRKIESQQGNEEPEHKTNSTENQKEIKCQYCKKTYKSTKWLNKHIENKHGDE